MICKDCFSCDLLIFGTDWGPLLGPIKRRSGKLFWNGSEIAFDVVSDLSEKRRDKSLHRPIVSRHREPGASIAAEHDHKRDFPARHLVNNSDLRIVFPCTIS